MPDRSAAHEVPEWIDGEACRIVAVLLADESLSSELEACVPISAGEFASLLEQRRAEMIAEGASCDAIAYRLAVMRHTRDALELRTALRALPTAGEDWPPTSLRPG
jgi:hypothetical protein